MSSCFYSCREQKKLTGEDCRTSVHTYIIASVICYARMERFFNFSLFVSLLQYVFVAILYPKFNFKSYLLQDCIIIGLRLDPVLCFGCQLKRFLYGTWSCPLKSNKGLFQTQLFFFLQPSGCFLRTQCMCIGPKGLRGNHARIDCHGVSHWHPGVIESVALSACFSWPKVFSVHPSLFIMRILLSVTKRNCRYELMMQLFCPPTWGSTLLWLHQNIE